MKKLSIFDRIYCSQLVVVEDKRDAMGEFKGTLVSLPNFLFLSKALAKLDIPTTMRTYTIQKPVRKYQLVLIADLKQKV